MSLGAQIPHALVSLLQQKQKLELVVFRIYLVNMEHTFPSAEAILDKAKKERPLTLEVSVVASFGDLCSSLRAYVETVCKIQAEKNLKK
jgi:hypothetical protein